jgi:hypothetical protein
MGRDYIVAWVKIQTLIVIVQLKSCFKCNTCSHNTTKILTFVLSHNDVSSTPRLSGIQTHNHHYVIKFVSDLWQVSGFLRVLCVLKLWVWIPLRRGQFLWIVHFWLPLWYSLSFIKCYCHNTTKILTSSPSWFFKEVVRTNLVFGLDIILYVSDNLPYGS